MAAGEAVNFVLNRLVGSIPTLPACALDIVAVCLASNQDSGVRFPEGAQHFNNWVYRITADYTCLSNKKSGFNSPYTRNALVSELV